MDVLVGTVEGDVGKDTEPDIPLAFEKCFVECVAGEWVGEEVAVGEELVEPCAAGAGVKGGTEIEDAFVLIAFGGLLQFTDLFAVGGVVGHWP